MALHVSAQDAARDLTALLAEVRSGQQVIIESESAPIAILQPLAETVKPRLLSESLALAEKRAVERGYEPVMDESFANDIEEAIRLRDLRPTRDYEWD